MVTVSHWAWTAPDEGSPPRIAEDRVDHPKSTTADAPLQALAHSSSEARQSYLLLALGIVVAFALPSLLRPHPMAFSAAPPTASSHSLPTSSP